MKRKQKLKQKYLHGVVVSSHRINDDFYMAPGTGKTMVKCLILSLALIYIYESIQNVKNVLPVNPKKERVRILVTDNRK
jgi:hypothetical protein